MRYKKMSIVKGYEMKNLLWKIVLVALLSVLSFGDDLQDAAAAFDKKDYKTAFRLYNSACEHGEAGGCAMVGGMFDYGLGIQKNPRSALEYYTKSCDMGDADGCKWATKIQNDIPVCTEDELSFLKDRRHFEVSSSGMNPTIVADTQTIRIDKRNKIIQVWITWVQNQKGRDEWIRKYGQDYNNLGYIKDLELINYGNMTSKINTFTKYNCDGSSIGTVRASEWDTIIPDSVMEEITESITKKYHLK